MIYALLIVQHGISPQLLSSSNHPDTSQERRFLEPADLSCSALAQYPFQTSEIACSVLLSPLTLGRDLQGTHFCAESFLTPSPHNRCSNQVHLSICAYIALWWCLWPNLCHNLPLSSHQIFFILGDSVSSFNAIAFFSIFLKPAILCSPVMQNRSFLLLSPLSLALGFFTLGNMACDTIVVVLVVVLQSRARKYAKSIAQNICMSLSL